MNQRGNNKRMPSALNSEDGEFSDDHIGRQMRLERHRQDREEDM
jgi:hypothetical protein